MEEYSVRNNEKQLQFEIGEGNDLAVLEYRFYKKSIAFMHTLVPESLKGKGIASALAAYAFAYAKEHKLPVMVYCPFVGAYLKRHPELREQLDKTFHRA